MLVDELAHTNAPGCHHRESAIKMSKSCSRAGIDVCNDGECAASRGA
ncbi:MAG: hypothetical protein ACLTDR_01205 [Adlercreutzia equolifaciens]